MERNLRTLSVIFIIILAFGSASSQLTIQFKDISEKFEKVDASAFPFYKSYVKAFMDGNPVVIGVDNVIIKENNRIVLPENVLAPDAEGWQEIQWQTRAPGIKLGTNYVDFTVFYQDGIAFYRGNYDEPNYSDLSIRNYDRERIHELWVGRASPGQTIFKQIYVTPNKGRLTPDSTEMLVRVDSVTVNSDNFSINWQGSELNMNPPPVNLQPGSFNLVDIYFHPEKDEYFRKLFTVHYEGGATESIHLIGNSFSISRRTLLDLLEPSGGEILAPCQEVEIKWTGHAKTLPTKVEFSSDDGISWQELALTEDSTIIWRVPVIDTDKALIKISQPFQSDQRIPLIKDNIRIDKISFSQNGSRLLSANRAGVVTEWDPVEKTELFEYRINSGFYPGIQTAIRGIEYTGENKDFVVCYRTNSASPDNSDSIAFFDDGVTFPVKRVGIEKDFYVKNMVSDSERRFLALVPAAGRKIMLRSPDDGSFIRYLDFEYPVGTISFNPKLDVAAVYLLNGEVRLLSLPDFNLIKSIDLSYLPLILEMGLSENGKFLGVGCEAPEFTISSGVNTEIHVIDIESEQIVRTSRKTASDPVGIEFNPTSSVLLVGSKGQPQIALWDLPSSDFIGSIGGSNYALNDFSFSPEGHMIAVSSNSDDNLIIRSFTYPEQDSSDHFMISMPSLAIDSIEVEPKYISTDNNLLFSDVICNRGLVPITFDTIYFKDGTHFRLPDQMNPLTLYPGECTDANVIFYPQDTGAISDLLIFRSNCTGNYFMEIKSEGLERNISFFRDVFDFGELCVGDTLIRNFDILKNEDPVPLLINGITFLEREGSPFYLTKPLSDTLIEPFGTLNLDIMFVPRDVGEVSRRLVVYHSDQAKFVSESTVRGKGFGINIGKSHEDLVFIPEIPTRTMTIYNNNEADISIDEATLNPEGIYTLNTQLPVFIPQNDSTELSITWNRTGTQIVIMDLSASPCVAKTQVYLSPYQATSTLSVPYVEADPRKDAVIPIEFDNRESKSYKGERFFEAEITLNPRLFLPESAESIYGNAIITRNEIIDDLRVIGVRVDGDFPAKGTAVEIRGIAGLDKVDTTVVEFTEGPFYWGAAASVATNPGMLKIINTGGRLIYRDKAVKILAVSPNPAEDQFNVEFESKTDCKAEIEIYDFLGNLVLIVENINVSKGINSVSVNSSRLKSGSYNIVLKTDSALDVMNIAIVK